MLAGMKYSYPMSLSYNIRRGTNEELASLLSRANVRLCKKGRSGARRVSVDGAWVHGFFSLDTVQVSPPRLAFKAVQAAAAWEMFDAVRLRTVLGGDDIEPAYVLRSQSK